jgi:hypothetical protein
MSVAPGFTANAAAASIKWYRDVPGFAVKERWEHGGQFHGAQIVSGAVTINIGQDDWKLGRDRLDDHHDDTRGDEADHDGSNASEGAHRASLGRPGNWAAIGRSYPIATGIERRIIGVGTLCAVPACLSQPARGRGRSLSADAMFTAGSRRTPAV